MEKLVDGKLSRIEETVDKVKIVAGNWKEIESYFTVGEGDNTQYFELKAIDGDIEFYWETRKECISFKNKGWKKNIFIDQHDIEGSHLKSYREIMNDYIVEKQEDVLSRGITKVSNGYIANNTYYETLEEIIGGVQ